MGTEVPMTGRGTPMADLCQEGGGGSSLKAREGRGRRVEINERVSEKTKRRE